MKLLPRVVRRSFFTLLHKTVNLLVIFAFMLQPFGATGFNVKVLASEGDATVVDSTVVAPAETPAPKEETVTPVEEKVVTPPKEEVVSTETPVVAPKTETVAPIETPVVTPTETPTETAVTTSPETPADTATVVTSVPTETSVTTETTPATEVVAPAPVEVPVVTPVIPVETWGAQVGSKATTNSSVELGKVYVAPQNDQVTVTFTKLPEKAGTLSIEEIILTPEQVKTLGALSDKAYDITSDMTDGTFAFDLNLPKPANQENVQIKFAETEAGLENADTVATGDVKTETNSVSAVLNHFTIFVVTGGAPTITTTTLVNNLQPSWTAAGGGGVWAEYWGPGENDIAVSPGATTVFGGREAGIIKAGYTSDGIPNWDQGLLGFKPTVTIDAFAIGALTYDVENQMGVNPVWMTIEVGTESNRNANSTYQFIPAAYSTGWHTINAAEGQWQLMDGNGNGTGPLMTLSEIATAKTGQNVVRVYLRLGMGDSYYNGGTGTTAWVDKVTIGGTTYDFVVGAGSTPTSCTGASIAPPSGTTACYSTIQAAIDAATPGETINVAAGTYELSAQLNVSKAISIVGNGAVTLKAVSDFGNTDGSKHLLGIYAGTVDTPVTISNVTLDCNGKCYGVNAYSNAYGILSDVTITNSKGAGLTVNGSTIDATNLNTSGNVVGAVNVDPGSGVTTPSIFKLNGGTLAEGGIYSDGSHVIGDATVTVNATGYTMYAVPSYGTKFFAWSKVTPAGASITKNNASTLYTTIAAAISAAADGDTINVGAGTYTEHLTIGKPLTINGANVGIAGNATRVPESIIDGKTSGVGDGVVVTITASNVTLNGFTIQNSGVNPDLNAGVVLAGVTGVTVSDNTITHNINGVVLTDSNTNTIQNNSIDTSAQYGILVGINPSSTSSTNTISGNTITASGADGIYVDGGSNSNRILSNYISGTTGSNDGDGIYLWYSDSNQVTGNHIFGNATNGIELSKASNNNLDGNTITGNSSTGIRIRATKDHDSASNIINNNIISENTLAGILLEKTGANGISHANSGTITNNTISTNVTGINIEFNQTYSIDATAWTVTGNKLSGNVSYGVSNGGTGVLNAAQNWWGNASGPGAVGSGTGDKVSTNISFSPWYTDAEMKTLVASDLVLTVSTPINITKTSLVSITGGQSVVNAAVGTAITGLTPIQVTLTNVGGIASANVRISPVNADSHIQLWAKDTSNNWFDINVAGWMDSAGNSIPAGYTATTDVYVISDVAGTYNLTANLVDAVTPSTIIKSASGTVTVNVPASIPAGRLPMLGTLTGVTLTSTLGHVAILNGLPATVDVTSNPTLFAELQAQHPGSGSDANSRYVGFMINPPVITGYEWYKDALKETTVGYEHDWGFENRGDSGTHDNGTELWETVAVKSGDVYNRTFRTPKNYEITWILRKTDSPDIAVTEAFTVEQVLDTIAPTVTSVDAATPGTIVYNFDEAVQLMNADKTGLITPDGTTGYASSLGIYNFNEYVAHVYGDPAPAKNGTITNAVLSNDNKTLTITYTGSLVKQVNTDYVVDAWGLNITDAAKNKVAQNVNQKFTVTGVDTLPTATVDGSVAGTITYTFSEPMQLTSNDGATVYSGADITSKLAIYKATAEGNYGVDTKMSNHITDATLVGNVLTVKYDGTLVDQTDAYYVVDAWGYKIADLTGNKMLPALSQIFKITGVDTIAPTATVTAHDESAKTITYTFNEPVQLNDNAGTETTLTADKLAIYVITGGNYGLDTKAAGVDVTGASLDAGKTVLTITYTGSLIDQVTRDYVVDAWGYRIADASNNKMLPNASQMFTVIEKTAPTITSSTINTVTKTIVYTLSEPIQFVSQANSSITKNPTGLVKIYTATSYASHTPGQPEPTSFGGTNTATSNGNVLTINYTDTLPTDSYLVDTWGYTVTDLAGNQLAESAAGIFAVDNTAPTLSPYTVSETIISPNGDEIKDSSSIDTAFSEPSHISINIKSGNTLVKNLYTSSGLVKNPDPYTWDGKNTSDEVVADGIYIIEITATDAAGNTLTDTSKTITVDTTPVVNNATLSVDPTYGLVLNFQTNEVLDLTTAANVQISYFTKVGNTLTPISNTMAANTPLVKDKTWDGYFVDASGNKYSKGTANVATDLNAVPANTTFTTLVKKGFAVDGSMNYVAITDWAQPATYVVRIVVTDNVGNVSTTNEVETTVVDSNVTDLNAAKATAAGLVAADAAESITVPGDHITGSLATLASANTAANATNKSAQSVVDGQVTTLNAAIAAYNLAIVAPSNVSAYDVTLAAVTEADYTVASWTTYQLVVLANVRTVEDTQAAVNISTGLITAAQGSLVTKLADAKTIALGVLTTALGTYTQTNYTVGNWTTLTGYKTTGDSAIDAATDLAGVSSAQSTATTGMAGVAKDLADAKTTALGVLTTALGTYTQANYTTGNWTTLTGFKTAGDTAINAATDLAGVSSAQSTATTGMAGVKMFSTTVITCPATVEFTSLALTPCTVAVTGGEGLNETPSPVYSANTAIGTANASYTFGGDAKHTSSSDSKNFVVEDTISLTPDNFAVGSPTQTTLALSWTNNELNGSNYVIKRSLNAITSENFDAATTLGGAPTPVKTTQGYVAKNLEANTTYYFAIKLTDTELNTSDIATTSGKTLTAAAKSSDTTAPSAIGGLNTEAGAIATSQIKLNWIATGDNGSVGIANKYIIKRSLNEITADNFDSTTTATTVFNSLSPKSAGSNETFTVTGLDSGTTYHFAIKAVDGAGLTSPFGADATGTTSALLPTIISITPTSGQNDSEHFITVTGTNFVTGTNTVRLTNSDNTFDLVGTYVSATSVTATVGVGLPAGTYHLRVIDANGTSDVSPSSYIITAAPAMPSVTDVVPSSIGNNDADVKVEIYGAGFAENSTAMLNNGGEGNTSLTITSVSPTKITATISGMLSVGTYNVRVTSAGLTNTVSAVQITVVAPEVIDSSDTQDVVTETPIDMGNTSTIPVQITMNSNIDNSTMDSNTTIEVVIPPDTTVKNDDGSLYTGNINPPQLVKPTDAITKKAGGDAVVITMGNPNETIKFSNDFVTTVTLETTKKTAPIIWYYNASSGLSIAGKEGKQDGVHYLPGGTTLNTVDNDGTYTYTIGLLLDHMSDYVAGVTPTISGISPSNGVTGTSVVITGTNFSPAAEVKFGDTVATVTARDGVTQITATVPSLSDGSYNVTVTNTDALTATLSSAFIDTTAATVAVVNAEGTKVQTDLNSAQVLVTALPAGIGKTDLQTRIDTLQKKIDNDRADRNRAKNKNHKSKGSSSKKVSTAVVQKKLTEFATFQVPAHQAAFRTVSAIQKTNPTKFKAMQAAYKKYVNVSGQLKPGTPVGIQATLKLLQSYNGYSIYLKYLGKK